MTEQRVFFCGGWTIATGETEADRQCAQEAMNGTENRANKKELCTFVRACRQGPFSQFDTVSFPFSFFNAHSLFVRSFL